MLLIFIVVIRIYKAGNVPTFINPLKTIRYVFHWFFYEFSNALLVLSVTSSHVKCYIACTVGNSLCLAHPAEVTAEWLWLAKTERFRPIALPSIECLLAELDQVTVKSNGLCLVLLSKPVAVVRWLRHIERGWIWARMQVSSCRLCRYSVLMCCLS